MTAVIALKATSSSIRRENRDDEQDREPGPCRHELVRLALDGIFPGGQRLEQLLDRIERVS